DGVVRQVGGVHLHAALLQDAHRLLDALVHHQVHPLLGAGAGGVEGGDAAGGPHRVHLADAHRVAAAHDGGVVVRLVDVLGQHGEVGLAAREHVEDAAAAAFGH